MLEHLHSIALRLLIAVAWLLLVSVALNWSSVCCAGDRPNILWITSEDNSPYLGCYGDTQAMTPNLDRLASEGVRYRNAFANAPVCSTARSTLITGMHASSLGVHNHRSSVKIPHSFLLYPEVFRQAGYYCTNNAKEDYNVAKPGKIWDESSRTAHYRKRGQGQPFFAVLNLTTSHESQVAAQPGKTNFRIAPEAFKLPPYHPDTVPIRRDWANYYDQMTQMDAQVGGALKELEDEGEAEHTIVFYYSDHGGALPGGKRNIHDAGTRVPLIIRFPEKWSHLAPASSGKWVDQPVAFVDLPATAMSLCNVAIPSHYEGQAFLGTAKTAPRELVYLFRGRMDERYDTVRAIRSKTHRYIKNYSPHRPYGQHYTYGFSVQPSMRSWFAAFQAGSCNDQQASYWLPKPAEEFYEIASDPYELDNRVADSNNEMLAQMRAKLRATMVSLRDVGLIPEGMCTELAGNQTIFEYAQSDAYPIERVVEIADQATSREVADLPALIAAMNDPHPVIRYWGATGCLVLGSQAGPAKLDLTRLVDDPLFDIRVVAAEAIGHLGEVDLASQTLRNVIEHGNRYEILAAQNAIEYLWVAQILSLPQAREILNTAEELPEPNNRIPKYMAEVKPSDRPHRGGH